VSKRAGDRQAAEKKACKARQHGFLYAGAAGAGAAMSPLTTLLPELIELF
jgi:hypothetical protein